MGHLIFLVLHIIALVFMAWALLLTLPLHLIYSAVGKKADAGPKPWTHFKCPDCKEFVNKEANVCRHCGCKLIPESQQPPQPFLDRAFHGPRTMGTKQPVPIPMPLRQPVADRTPVMPGK